MPPPVDECNSKEEKSGLALAAAVVEHVLQCGSPFNVDLTCNVEEQRLLRQILHDTAPPGGITIQSNDETSAEGGPSSDTFNTTIDTAALTALVAVAACTVATVGASELVHGTVSAIDVATGTLACPPHPGSGMCGGGEVTGGTADASSVKPRSRRSGTDLTQVNCGHCLTLIYYLFILEPVVENRKRKFLDFIYY